MIGVARTKSKCCNIILGNVLDKDEVRKAIHSEHYEYIINGVGVLNKFVDTNQSSSFATSNENQSSF